MSNRSLSSRRVILPTLAILFLLGASVAGTGFVTMEAQSQNATNVTGTSANQTGTNNQSAGPLGNLTRVDFDSVGDNLAIAREALQNQDPTSAYNALGSADIELFGIATSQGDQNMATLNIQFEPIRDGLQQAQKALATTNDPSAALDSLNSADVKYFELLNKLPSEESEEAEE
jgi:hypothetical protein